MSASLAPSIFTYSDPRQFMVDRFAAFKRLEPGLSVRAWASRGWGELPDQVQGARQRPLRPPRRFQECPAYHHAANLSSDRKRRSALQGGVPVVQPIRGFFVPVRAAGS